jgi:hypothetical protein
MDDIRLSTGKRGAISEMLVASDLLDRGYEVFRSVSQDCSCDLLALKDGKASRIEVRTGYSNKGGTVGCSISEKDFGRFDILAIVLDGRIIYQDAEAARTEWRQKSHRRSYTSLECAQ